MCCDNNTTCDNCFDSIINTILTLQDVNICKDDCSGCDKPFLGGGSNCILYNTRPLTFYTCRDNTLWKMPYNDNNDMTSAFRLEKKDGCCVTCRCLAPNTDQESGFPYIATNRFFTINLNCVGSIQCLEDTYVACI